ncbi:serine-threonine kinase [Only Syngen Nebraska virus 5]|uniref:serine-threonine kinase n=1 Tax=Only Syngen Nebraska virus 5 TaxID=1917232 RepID=UPI0009009E36|nr:serine-threonine kinase [Only Syngen Nebraska virus 5]APC25646.1 Ser/Thr-protein kinase [Only Syngen Nebraska virus 5]
MSVVTVPTAPAKTLKEYNINTEIARGGFARVYRATRGTGEKIAVKSIKTKRYESFLHARHVIVREYEILKSFDCDQIIKPLGINLENHDASMILPLYTTDMLMHAIQSKYGMPEGDVLKVGFQMARAVKCIHDNGYVHRDIKPGNVLYRWNLDDVVLCDFGITEKETDIRQYNFAGTEPYVAPELTLKSRVPVGTYEELFVGKPTDIFSLGATLFFILSLTNVLEPGKHIDPNEIQTKVSNLNCSALFKDFLMKVLEPNPMKRLTIEEVLDHEVFQPFA